MVILNRTFPSNYLIYIKFLEKITVIINNKEGDSEDINYGITNRHNFSHC